MTHETTVTRYPGTLAELADAIGDLRYDALQEFLECVAEKLREDADKDGGRKRHRLESCLRNTADRLDEAAAEIKDAWRIAEPFMRDATKQVNA